MIRRLFMQGSAVATLAAMTGIRVATADEVLASQVKASIQKHLDIDYYVTPMEITPLQVVREESFRCIEVNFVEYADHDSCSSHATARSIMRVLKTGRVRVTRQEPLVVEVLDELDGRFPGPGYKYLHIQYFAHDDSINWAELRRG